MKWLLGGILAAMLMSVCIEFASAFEIEHAKQSVVRLSNEEGNASGVIIADRLVLTAAHVADELPERVWGLKGDKLVVDYAVGSWDTDAPAARVDCDWRPTLGEKLYALSYPAFMGLTYSEGYVNTLSLDFDDGEAIGAFGADLVIGTGSSGGPVYSEAGDVVALISRGMFQLNLNYAPWGSFWTLGHHKSVILVPVWAMDGVCS